MAWSEARLRNFLLGHGIYRLGFGTQGKKEKGTREHGAAVRYEIVRFASARVRTKGVSASTAAPTRNARTKGELSHVLILNGEKKKMML